MKLILSRKGFDSAAGTVPSIFTKDGKMLSFPIPSTNATIPYSEINFDNTTIDSIFTDLGVYQKSSIKKGALKNGAHLDPDLNINSRKRAHTEGWKGSLGQVSSSQSHLTKMGVGVGDLFLFFGWYHETKKIDGKYSYTKGVRDKHCLFGYLQIGEILEVSKETKVPKWLEDHPHCSDVFRTYSPNTIYIASDTLSLNSDLPGWGTFSFSEEMVLTKKEQHKKSIWNLPKEIFGEVDISYHPNPWKGDDFQSVGRGQEFVMTATDAIQQWALHKIMKGLS